MNAAPSEPPTEPAVLSTPDVPVPPLTPAQARAVLGVSESATWTEIHRAYSWMHRFHHQGADGMQEKVQAAYDCLVKVTLPDAAATPTDAPAPPREFTRGLLGFLKGLDLPEISVILTALTMLAAAALAGFNINHRHAQVQRDRINRIDRESRERLREYLALPTPAQETPKMQATPVEPVNPDATIEAAANQVLGIAKVAMIPLITILAVASVGMMVMRLRSGNL